MPDIVRPQATYRLPDTLLDDIEKLGQMAEQVRADALEPDRFRAFRVPMGVYEQRESGRFMLRVRLPGGGLLPHQMRVLADVSERVGNGILHVTTRQDIQVHRVALESIHPALVALYGGGLATKGGGGNTVRNVTTCPRAGVCPKEAFDVTPCALALTEFLIADPLSFKLPRKYKIAFSGCPRDCAGATVNDLGFIATQRGGEPGFAVYVGGGMGAHSRVADPLDPFLPASAAHLVAETIKRVFDQHGNRKNKHRARLRFLIEQIGLPAFRALYDKEMAAVCQSVPLRLATRPSSVPRSACPTVPPEEDTAGQASRGTQEGLVPRSACPTVPSAGGARLDEPAVARQEGESAPGGSGFDRWRAANVEPQKQQGFHLVTIPLPLGDIAAPGLRSLADAVGAHGDGMLRVTQTQNALLRWVREDELAALYAELAALGLAESQPPILRDLVACAGASTCRLGMCLSRGLAKAIAASLSRNGLDLRRLGHLDIHISGCPNGCGRHPIGAIALVGAARRVGGRLVPCYIIQLGGRVGEGRTRLAEGDVTVPGRNVPSFVKGLIVAFLNSPHCPDFDAFLDAGGRRIAHDIAVEFREVPDFAADKNFYFDWGADELFSLAGRGPGECSAGVFDLITVDLASAAEAVKAGRRYAATALAARALLVTRGEEPANDPDALRLFQKHFLAEKLIDPRFAPLIESALFSASAPSPEAAFEGDLPLVAALVDAVRDLYARMDDSLRFTSTGPPREGEAPAEPPRGDTRPACRPSSAREPRAATSWEGEAPAEPAADISGDYRGVACPLNYVKAKLALEEMEPGQILTLVLGKEGTQNVPASATRDGHQVLSVTQEGDNWRVVIRKG